jgi:hypothetical protein
MSRKTRGSGLVDPDPLALYYNFLNDFDPWLASNQTTLDEAVKYVTVFESGLDPYSRYGKESG